MADRQTHVHSAHLFSCSWPTTERSATERESQRKAALQQMVLLKELRWNSLCYKSSLVFFETPIGSGPPAGLRSNVLRPNECIDTHTLLSIWCIVSPVFLLWIIEQTEFQLRLINCPWNSSGTRPKLPDSSFDRWLHWDYEFSIIIQYNTD